MKRLYELYIMNSEMMHSYFGFENKIYQLFKDMELCNDMNKIEVIKKQIMYITKELSLSALEGHLIYHNCTIIKNNDGFIFTLASCSGAAYIKHNDRVIYIEAYESLDSEARFFEVLRSFNKFFFAVELETEKYGWLSPIKQQKLA